MSAINREESPPLVANWSYNDGTEQEIPSVHGRFENDWRFEIKPIDGETFYDLARPLDEESREEWHRDAGPGGWSFISFDAIMDELITQLNDAKKLSDLEGADTDVVHEFGMFFAMLEREGL